MYQFIRLQHLLRKAAFYPPKDPVKIRLQLQIEGDWNLIEYYTSFDGKPFPPHSPYLCPESRMVFNPEGSKMNISQVK